MGYVVTFLCGAVFGAFGMVCWALCVAQEDENM